MFSFITAVVLSSILSVSALTTSGGTCPSSPPVSCSSSATSNPPDRCCESGDKAFLQTQFWTTDGFAAPSNSWGVHGLWADECNGSFTSNCDSSRNDPDIRSILANGGAQSTLDYMNTYFIDNRGDNEGFWQHEWNAHGTCASTIEPECYGSSFRQGQDVIDYFQKIVQLFRELPTYSWLAAAGITPSSTRTYSLSQLQAVAQSNFGYQAVWQCYNGELEGVYYRYNTKGSLQSGQFIPSYPLSSSSCPS